MKALIVDDEYPIVQGMLRLIRWRSLGIETVRSAYSVDHAIEILQSEPVDSIITDIRMKGRTGLDLLDWVNGIYANCAKIILTSYPDFNYAREAISLGVNTYGGKLTCRNVAESFEGYTYTDLHELIG